MKKIHFLAYVLMFLYMTISTAQSVDGFKYDIKILDNSAVAVINQNIEVQITIFDQNNNVLYQEQHSTSTDDFGYSEIIIGEGNAIQGDFSNIVWSSPMSFKTEVNFGNGWVDYGTQTFAYAPYAKWSDFATKALQVDFNDLTNVPQDIADGDDSGATEINDLKDGATYSQGRSLYLGTDAGTSDDNTDNYNTGVGYKALQNVSSGYYNTAVGALSLKSTTTGYENTALGAEALQSNTTGYGNTALGYQSLKNNTQGSYNVGAGYTALTSNTTGNHNTALGTSALSSNTSGSYNVAVGSNALASGNTHHYNVAIGKFALRNNTTGSYNIAIGNHALYNNTVRNHLIAIGDSALFYNGVNVNNPSQAIDNLAVGHYALLNNTTGSKNVAIGISNMRNSVHGSENVAIGQFAHMGTGGNYNVIIANNSLLNNPTDPGNSGDGNVGIGDKIFVLPKNISNCTFIGEEAGYYVTDNSTNSTVIGSDGTLMNLGSNIVYFSTPHSLGLDWIGGQVTWSTYSDKRIKKDVMENVPGLDFIMRLRPVTYYVNYDKIKQKSFSEKNTKENDSSNIKNKKIRRSGFIAQEVEQAAKEIGYDFSGIYKPKDGKGLYRLSYAQFVVPLVKAKQEQQYKINTLTEKKENISRQLERAEIENRQLEEKIKRLEQLKEKL